jgi:hypothetical protein
MENTQLSETEKIIAMRVRDADNSTQRERLVESRVQAITKIRMEIEAKVKEYQEQCGLLQHDFRRVTVAESQIHYRTFVTMQLRMAGAISQALVRAKSMDKILVAAKVAVQERQTQDELDKVKLRKRDTESKIAKLQLPQSDDMEMLYGEELANASA